MYTVKAFAKLTGVTERTLHFYDRKGLLAPSSYNEHGHRLYSKDDIPTMQKIITLKYLGSRCKKSWITLRTMIHIRYAIHCKSRRLCWRRNAKSWIM
ncbi:MerR family transcriptional regulator [Paenibacillus sp. S-12]|uniref:MerR family transcriptional regulator n=1 Tax=Paenibacillus sp. S-12 TaxID=3031371 RepID=UPI00338EBFAB